VAVAGPVFLDTSILLAGLIELAGPEAPAQRIMAGVATGRFRRAQTAWHCCLEFYSVATRLPEEFRLAPADAGRLLEAEVLDRLQVHDLPAEARRDLLREAAADQVVGGRLYDGHIAQVARAAGARLVVTENRRHFTGLLRHRIAVFTAEEFAAEAGLAGGDR
jgi:predicted nucleic acid-binding protein